jgi:folate-binding protein YgfZ
MESQATLPTTAELPLAERSKQASALEHRAGLLELPDQSLLRVQGDDARSWLNGQITADVRHTAPGDAVYGLVLSLKGKIMADLWVLDEGPDGDAERFALVVPAGRRHELLEYLDRFIIMEDVELEESPEAILTVQGPRAQAVVRAVQAPAFPCDRLGVGGYDVVAAPDERASIYEALASAVVAEGGLEVSASAFELARLRAARGRYGVDFGDHTLPQEAGLKRRAVAFDKGCYQGQEPVIMLEHRGKPPKRLVRLAVEGDCAPPPGSELESAEGRPAGTITSAAVDPDASGGPTVLALALVRRAFVAEGARFTVGGRPAALRDVVD